MVDFDYGNGENVRTVCRLQEPIKFSSSVFQNNEILLIHDNAFRH